jgi:chromosome segregation ATPase
MPNLELKTEIELLKQSTSGLFDAQKETTSAITNLANAIGGLVSELKAKEVKDTYLENEVKKIKDEQSDFENFARPVVVRAKRGQDRTDKLLDALVTGTPTKLFYIIVGAGILSLLGANLSGLFKL